MIRVTVVIPLYNKVQYILRTLESVFAQTCQDFEIIVVDDGSTDGGSLLVEALSDPRIRLLHQENAGVAAARNAGIKAARGEWIAFLDADDYWLPEHLYAQLHILERHPQIHWSAGRYTRRLANNTTVRIPEQAVFEHQYDGELVQDGLALLPYGYLWTGVIMVRASVLTEIGGFDPGLRTAEDLDLWLRIAVRYPQLAYCMAPIAEYTVYVAGSLSRQKIVEPLEIPHFRFARKHLPMIDTLAVHRAKSVRAVCQRLVNMGIKKLLLAGDAVAALQVLEEFGVLLGARLSDRYRVLSRVPSAVLRVLFVIKEVCNNNLLSFQQRYIR